MITHLVSGNINKNEKLAIVDINLGYNKSVDAYICQELTLLIKGQDYIRDNEKLEIIKIISVKNIQWI